MKLVRPRYTCYAEKCWNELTDEDVEAKSFLCKDCSEKFEKQLKESGLRDGLHKRALAKGFSGD